MIRLTVFVSSVQKEMANAGSLPPTLTLEKLRQPHGSVPGNPLIAESLYLAKYIERMGTGVSFTESIPFELMILDAAAKLGSDPRRSRQPCIPAEKVPSRPGGIMVGP